MGLTLAAASSQYVNIGNYCDLTTGDFSVCCVAKWTTTSVGHILSKWDGPNEKGYALLASTSIYWRVGGKVSGDASTGSQYWYTNSAFNDGAWHWICCTIDRDGNSGKGQVQIYVDGEAQALTAVANLNASATASNTVDLDIGRRRPVDTPYYFSGSLADVRIYNRLLYSHHAKEIAQHRGCDNVTSGLIGRWLLDEMPDGFTLAASPSPTLARDISTGGHDGTSYALPTYCAVPMRLIK